MSKARLMPHAAFEDLDVDPRAAMPHEYLPLLSAACWALIDGLRSFRSRVQQNVDALRDNNNLGDDFDPDIVHLFMNPFEDPAFRLEDLGLLKGCVTGWSTQPAFMVTVSNLNEVNAALASRARISQDTLNRMLSNVYEVESFDRLISAKSCEIFLQEQINAGLVETSEDAARFTWKIEDFRWFETKDRPVCGAFFQTGQTERLDALFLAAREAA